MTSSSSNTSSVDLPDEIIESIRSKLSKKQNKFLVWAKPGLKERSRMHLIILEDGKFQTQPVLGYPSEDFIPLCSCNGLILLGGLRLEFMLWNPLLRKHFIIPALNRRSTYMWMRHLYRYSLTNDYKIVVCLDYGYTVYSCNNKSWGEKKDFPELLHRILSKSVFVDGCLYVLDSDKIMSFDARDGKQHKFQQPEGCLIQVKLEAVSGRLCLRGFSNCSRELWVMGNKNGSSDKCWRKLISREKKEPKLGRLNPLCLNNEDDVVLWSNGPMPISGTSGYIYYSRKNCSFQEIGITWQYSPDYFPYSESLYMPSS